MMTEITFTVENLKAGFGSHQVLRDINMQIPSRRVTAIIGPSGCGKSTLIRCLNRMHEVVPEAYLEGKIFLEGSPIYGVGIDPVLVRRRVGMVFQKANLFPSMTIFQNVASGLVLNGVRKKNEIQEKVESSLRKSALWEEVKGNLHESAMKLSGGQQQRLCIARALAIQPQVLLMDEPCSALDPISTARVEELIHELRENYTVVIVTHNMQQAARVSDFTAFLYMGELVEFGETKVLFTTPREKRTEDYITGRFG